MWVKKQTHASSLGVVGDERRGFSQVYLDKTMPVCRLWWSPDVHSKQQEPSSDQKASTVHPLNSVNINPQACRDYGIVRTSCLNLMPYERDSVRSAAACRQTDDSERARVRNLNKRHSENCLLTSERKLAFIRSLNDFPWSRSPTASPVPYSRFPVDTHLKAELQKARSYNRVKSLKVQTPQANKNTDSSECSVPH